MIIGWILTASLLYGSEKLIWYKYNKFNKSYRHGLFEMQLSYKKDWVGKIWDMKFVWCGKELWAKVERDVLRWCGQSGIGNKAREGEECDRAEWRIIDCVENWSINVYKWSRLCK